MQSASLLLRNGGIIQITITITMKNNNNNNTNNNINIFDTMQSASLYSQEWGNNTDNNNNNSNNNNNKIPTITITIFLTQCNQQVCFLRNGGVILVIYTAG